MNNIMTWFCRLLRLLVIVDFIVGLLATVVAIVAAKVLGRLPVYRRTNPQLAREAA